MSGQTDLSQNYLNDVKRKCEQVILVLQDKLMYICFYFCSVWKHVQTMVYTENFAGVFAYLVKQHIYAPEECCSLACV